MNICKRASAWQVKNINAVHVINKFGQNDFNHVSCLKHPYPFIPL